jgi:hypothetical protein
MMGKHVARTGNKETCTKNYVLRTLKDSIAYETQLTILKVVKEHSDKK